MMYPKNRNIDIDTFDGLTKLTVKDKVIPVVEDVTVGCEFDETASVVIPATIDHKYTQSSKCRGITRYFKIYNKIYMHQAIESLKNNKESNTRINLTFLNPDPVRQKYYAWNWLYSALALCFLSVQIIYIGEYSQFEIAHPYMLPIGTLLMTISMILTQIFFYRSQDKMIYRSFVADVPLIELFYKPGDIEYQIFTVKLKLHILQAQNRDELNMKHRLKGELSDLRRLSEEGVILNKTYARARDVILKHKAYS